MTPIKFFQASSSGNKFRAALVLSPCQLPALARSISRAQAIFASANGLVTDQSNGVILPADWPMSQGRCNQLWTTLRGLKRLKWFAIINVLLLAANLCTPAMAASTATDTSTDTAASILSLRKLAT